MLRCYDSWSYTVCPSVSHWEETAAPLFLEFIQNRLQPSGVPGHGGLWVKSPSPSVRFCHQIGKHLLVSRSVNCCLNSSTSLLSEEEEAGGDSLLQGNWISMFLGREERTSDNSCCIIVVSGSAMGSPLVSKAWNLPWCLPSVSLPFNFLSLASFSGLKMAMALPYPTPWCP